MANQALLPVPVVDQLVEARQMLDLQIEPMRTGAAGFSRRFVKEVAEARKGWLSVVYFDRVTPKLVEATRFLSEFTLLFRAVRKDTRSFELMLRNAQQRKPAVPGYAKFLASAREWILPTGVTPFGRELVLWGQYNQIRRHTDRQGRFMDGHLVTYQEAGPFVQALLDRKTIGGTSTPGSSFAYRGKLRPEQLAAPLAIRWRATDVLVGSKAYGYWTGVIATLEKDPAKQLPDLLRQLDELLALEVDVLIHFTRVERKLYAELLVRAESSVSSSGATTLDQLQDKFDLIGSGWERLSGDRVREAHFAFMPGHQPAPAWKPFLFKRPDNLFERLGQAVSPQTAHQSGCVAFGKLGMPEQPFFLEPTSHPSVVIEGQSGSGKSTLAAFTLLQQTADVVWFQLKSADKEGSQRWATDFGGTIIPIDLADVNQGVDGKSAAEVEVELFRKDAQSAQELVKKLAAKWRSTGESWLPLAIHPRKNSLRYYNWVLAFYEALSQEWALWTTESGRILHVVFDDMVSWPMAADSFLGDLGPNLGSRARIKMREAVDTVRKDRQHICFTVHSVAELEKDYPAGFLSSCTLLVRLGNDGHSMADVYDPRRLERSAQATVAVTGGNGQHQVAVAVDQEKIARLQVHLPAVLVEYLGRSD